MIVELKLVAFCLTAVASCLICESETGSCTSDNDVTLAVAIMVRNEEEVLATTLESALEFGISTFFVYDTGSTDRTIQIALDFAKSRTSIDLFVKSGTFKDFATSRNEMLDWACGKSRWLILFDAGDILRVEERNRTSLVNFLRETPEEHCGYMIEQVWDLLHFFNIRMIRNDGRWHYEFPVHEFLEPAIEWKSTCTTPMLHEMPGAPFVSLYQNRRRFGHASPKRWKQDALVLEAFLHSNQDHPRALFYLGNTYMQLAAVESDKEKKESLYGQAMEAYSRRISIVNSWYEEKEVSMFYLALCNRYVKQYHDMRYWGLRLFHDYGRVEGLLLLARHAIDKDNLPLLCYAYADMACSVAKPVRTLFLDAKEYDEFRYNLRDYCKKVHESAK